MMKRSWFLDEKVKSPPTALAQTRSDPLQAVVAIPVNNERERIADCLGALAVQTRIDPRSFGVLLFLNNCTDGTAAAIAAMPPTPLRLRVIEVEDAAATAGWARRRAMEAAAEWLEASGARDGVILTSDADSRVGPEWVWRNLAHVEAGADAVAGRISLDPAEAAELPDHLHARGRLEADYEALLTEIGARLDPEPANPWPCHWTRSGATLAVRLAAYRAVGGMPALPNGEDNAFVTALRADDFAVRHAPDIAVVTSGRLVGRATGGAADTMRLRCETPDSPCDDRLEPLHRAVKRVLWRRRLRHVHAGRDRRSTWLWAPFLRIGRQRARSLLAIPRFGRFHRDIEAISPSLAYKPVVPAQLPAQIRRARLLLTVLRCLDRLRSAEYRVDTRPLAAEAGAPQTQPTLP